MALTVRIPRGSGPELRYAVHTVLGTVLGLEVPLVEDGADGVVLTDGSRELVVEDCFFAAAREDWLGPATLPPPDVPGWDLGADGLGDACLEPVLPVLYGRRLAGGSFLERTPSGLRLGLDVFGAAFFLLSRYEEAVLPDRDAFGRFPAPASAMGRLGVLHRPLVDEYALVLLRCIQRLWPQVQGPAREASTLATHDVDHPYRYLSGSPRRRLENAARDLLGGPGRLACAWTMLRVLGGAWGEDPYDTFSWIMDANEARGVRTVFFFGGARQLDPWGGGYDPASAPVRRILGAVHERGHEIGLHVGYHSAGDARAVERELAALRRACEMAGVRQDIRMARNHYLRWRTPGSFEALARAGITQDSTLGFPEAPGFRSGTCVPHEGFDPVNRRPAGVRVVPLVLQEYSVLDGCYMALAGDGEACAAQFDRVRQACTRYAGTLTFLWHNSSLATDWDRRMYERLLDGE